MNQEKRLEILEKAKDFFRKNVVEAHINAGLERASQLDEYNVNPFLFKYLANFLRGNDSPRSIAEALIYPRILGSSITTIFGTHWQAIIAELFEGMGSVTHGIDIEYIDALDGKKKYCQIKSGPNTINKDDITTILNHFKDIRGLARVNKLSIGIDDLVVGVLYGTPAELSNHYNTINKTHPVFVGQEFWYRITGDENFYFELIESIGSVAKEVDASKKLEEAIEKLTQEVKAFLEE
ncbi:hypothetical protein BH09BAC1_BH09BAC1_02810 [soil metagenome]